MLGLVDVSLRDRFKSRTDSFLAAPLYVVLAVLVALPLGYLVYGSLQTGAPSAPAAEFTWSHIQALWTQPRYRHVLRNTLQMAALVTVISVTLGVFFAWMVARTNVPFKRVWELLIPMPLFLAPFASAVAWVILGSRRAGFLNVFYQYLFAAETGFMNIMTFPGLIFVMVLFYTPYAYLFTIAPLQNMDGSLEEASRVAGASLRQTFVRVTFPVIVPGVLSATLMVFVISAELFSVPALIGTAAGYETIPTFIYQSTQLSPPNWGGASAAGLMLLVIMAVGMILQHRATRLTNRFVTVSGKGLKPTMIRLGRWRWVLFAVASTYVFVAVVLPWGALILGSFTQFLTTEFSTDLLTTRHWRAQLDSRLFRRGLGNSLFIGVLGPTIAVTFAFLLTYIWHRTKAPFRRVGETVAMLPIAIPGIVFGVGILWAFVRSPLYGTVWLLILAYVVRYLPHPLRMFSSTLVQVDSGLEEASRVGGAGIFRTLRSISAPLVKPAALTAWVLLFILFMRELNVAIMVVTGRSMTLPVLMWMEADGGYFQRASIIALVEAVIVIIAFLIAKRVFGLNLSSHRSQM